MARKKKSSRTTKKQPRTQAKKKAVQQVANNPRAQAMAAQIGRMMQKATEHHQRKEFPAAMQIYRRVLTVQPTNVMALNNLGLMLFQKLIYSDRQDK